MCEKNNAEKDIGSKFICKQKTNLNVYKYKIGIWGKSFYCIKNDKTA